MLYYKNKSEKKQISFWERRNKEVKVHPQRIINDLIIFQKIQLSQVIKQIFRSSNVLRERMYLLSSSKQFPIYNFLSVLHTLPFFDMYWPFHINMFFTRFIVSLIQLSGVCCHKMWGWERSAVSVTSFLVRLCIYKDGTELKPTLSDNLNWGMWWKTVGDCRLMYLKEQI